VIPTSEPIWIWLWTLSYPSRYPGSMSMRVRFRSSLSQTPPFLPISRSTHLQA